MLVTKMRPSGACAKKRARGRPVAAMAMSRFAGKREGDRFRRERR